MNHVGPASIGRSRSAAATGAWTRWCTRLSGTPSGTPFARAPSVALFALLPALLTMLPACAEAADGGISATGSILRMLMGLGVVLLVMLALAWLLRRLGAGAGTSSGTGPLRVVASVAVGQRERVVLVLAGDRQLLVGVAPGRVTALGEIDGELPLDPAPARPDFAASLQRVLGGMGASR